MSKLIDLTGKKFGRLTVVSKAEKPKNRTESYWLCECECGKKIILPSSRVRYGDTKSCGCIVKDGKDLTGMRFGKLTAIKRTKGEKDSCYLWFCKCDCGNFSTVPTRLLMNGNTKSCGCLQKEISRKNVKEKTQKIFDKTNLYAIENTLYKKIRKDNTSGFTGVYHNKKRGIWISQMTFKGSYFRKSFKSKSDAIAYRKKLEEKFMKPTLDYCVETGIYEKRYE